MLSSKSENHDHSESSSSSSMTQPAEQKKELGSEAIRRLDGFAMSIHQKYVRQEPITGLQQAFNNNFSSYLGLKPDAAFSKKHGDFLLLWRIAYVKYMFAQELESEDLDAAIAAYEEQISILKAIPLAVLKKNDTYSLITKHSLAKAYYQLGVLYREKAKHQVKEVDEDDEEDDLQSRIFLLSARKAFEKGLRAYQQDLVEVGYSDDCVGEDIDPRLFSIFDTDSVRNRIAALFLNLADIDESLENYPDATREKEPGKFKDLYKKAFAALPQKGVIRELVELITSALDYHEIDRPVPKSRKDRPVKKADDKGKPKAKKAKQEEFGTKLLAIKRLSIAEAIQQFSQQKLPTVLRKHQVRHLQALQKKCDEQIAEPVREFGIVSATGSGKTMCILSILNALYGAPNQRLTSIFIVPTQDLIDQTAEKSKEYHRNGLPNLPGNDQEIGKWYSAQRTIRPFTVTTYASWVKAVNASVAVIPTQEAFDEALAKNEKLLWERPEFYFSPFNKQSVLVFDEAHHMETAITYLATYARFICPDLQKDIDKLFVGRKEKAKKRALKREGKEEGPDSQDLARVPQGSASQISLTSAKGLLEMIRRARMPGSSVSERCLCISATATPGKNYATVFPIDSHYGITQAIDDGVSPPLQIIEMRLKDSALISKLKQRLGIKKKVDPDAEFTREQQTAINDFMLDLAPFYQLFGEVVRAIPFKKAIIFTPTVKHATTMFQSMDEGHSRQEFMLGIMHSNTSKAKNDKVAQEFRKAKRGCLINCKKVGEGSDFPEVDLIIELRVFKTSLCAVIQAAGRSLRAKEGSALYLWFNLQIGQLDPVEVIFSGSTSDRYKFPNNTSATDIASKLLSPEVFPETITQQKKSLTEVRATVDCQVFSIITPGGFEVSYDAAGKRVIAAPTAVAAPVVARSPAYAGDAKSSSSSSSSSAASWLSFSSPPLPSRYGFFGGAAQQLESFASLASPAQSMPSLAMPAPPTEVTLSRKRKLLDEEVVGEGFTDFAVPAVIPPQAEGFQRDAAIPAGFFGPGKHPRTLHNPFAASSSSFSGSPNSSSFFPAPMDDGAFSQDLFGFSLPDQDAAADPFFTGGFKRDDDDDMFGI